MNALTLLAIFVVGASGYLIKVPKSSVLQTNSVDGGWVHIQQVLLPLFDNVCEDSTNSMVVRLAQDFNLDSLNSKFNDPNLLINLKNLRAEGLLPKGDIFSEFNSSHMSELKTIYDVLYESKDFDTFLHAAAWARQNMNCGLFVNAIYLAILNRKDTSKVSLPAPYELLPNYFVRKDTVTNAMNLLTNKEEVPADSVNIEANSYILKTNYTCQVDDNEESQLAYFREDIGLNSYYFFMRLKKAPWFNSISDINNKYGENLYHIMKQLAARYNLERYSNGLPELESITWDTLVDSSYDPMLIYSNGADFPERTHVNLSKIEDINLLKSIEDNIVMIATHMNDSGFNKVQILNHLMEILITGERSYENLLRQHVYSGIINREPSALDHYATSVRDPVFWKINKKIVDLIEKALKILPSYSKNELFFPGVQILNVDTKKLSTSLDQFEYEVTDAFKTSVNSSFRIKISQSRLNNKPFNIKLSISSLVTQKAFVKIFIGPKLLPGEITEKKPLYMLLDSFEMNLKMGTNTVSRSSRDMELAEDLTPLRVIQQKVNDAEFGLDALPLKNILSQSGFPSRLILPKGSVGGLPLQMLILVAPYVKITNFDNLVSSTEYNWAVNSPGYPFDLDIALQQLIDLPNVLIKDVIITHKGDSTQNYRGVNQGSNYGGYYQRPEYAELNQDNSEVENRNDMIYLQTPARPENSYRKQPFDYQSKKGQYENKQGQYENRQTVTNNSDKYSKNFQEDITTLETTTNDEFQETTQIIPQNEGFINENEINLVAKDTFSTEEPSEMQNDERFQSEGNNIQTLRLLTMPESSKFLFKKIRFDIKTKKKIDDDKKYNVSDKKSLNNKYDDTTINYLVHNQNKNQEDLLIIKPNNKIGDVELDEIPIDYLNPEKYDYILNNKDDDEDSIIRESPKRKQPITLQKQTVYDYLMPNFLKRNTTDENVYD